MKSGILSQDQSIPIAAISDQLDTILSGDMHYVGKNKANYIHNSTSIMKKANAMKRIIELFKPIDPQNINLSLDEIEFISKSLNNLFDDISSVILPLKI